MLPEIGQKIRQCISGAVRGQLGWVAPDVYTITEYVPVLHSVYATSDELLERDGNATEFLIRSWINL